MSDVLADSLRKLLRCNALRIAVIIDVDQFVFAVPEFADLRANDPNDAVRRVYVEAIDVIWDIIGDGPALANELDKEIGYCLQVEFVDCPFDVAMD